MRNVNHVLGISGGKDSAALAVYMSKEYPNIDIEYYTCDTGKELKETYDLISKLNSVLGKNIKRYDSVDSNSPIKNPFDHFLALYGGYLPSPMARWCTKKMKLQPFEDNVGDKPTISYVGIRGDEHREGYISKKENIQTIFPFRKNIWSEDVIKSTLDNSNAERLKRYYKQVVSDKGLLQNILRYVAKPISFEFTQKQKLNALLDADVRSFNKVVFEYLKTTDYPVGMLDEFPLVENIDNLVLEDIFRILEDSGVGVPAYYKPIEYEVEINGELKKGIYSRSRSGCFFCFYQQKIEWVWLLEQHPELFDKAISYEKEGYSWAEERLEELKKPERVKAIKKEHYLRTLRQQKKSRSNSSWQDEILQAEGEGCASCFI